MSTPQGGIFALGTSSHAYLEFDVLAGKGDGASWMRSRPCASLGPRWAASTWWPASGPSSGREVAPDDAPPGVEGFNEDVVGVDGFVMPATQHDAVLWLSGSAYDVIFDTARVAIAALRDRASSPRRPRAGRTATTWI